MTSTTTEQQVTEAAEVAPAQARPEGRVLRAAVWLPGLAVALGAAVATAHGLFEVAVAARVPVGIAWLYPLITDGLALVAYAATARLHGAAARYAWGVVVLAAGLSGLAQAVYLAGDATVDASPALRFGVGAWPAIAAAVVAHLLYLLADNHPPAGHAASAQPELAPPVGGKPTRPALAEPAALAASAVSVMAAEHRVALAERDVESGLSEHASVVADGGQPGVQPTPYSRMSVQPDPYTPVYDATADALADAAPAPAPAALNASVEHPGGSVEHPAGPVEHPLNDPAGSAPRDRARAAAAEHLARHGALPTVSELEAAAAVSRGTAAAALKALRGRPHPLHLVPDTPHPETQP
jgi:hypothetical protein